MRNAPTSEITFGTRRNLFLFSKEFWELHQRNKVLGFTSVLFYVCGLAGKSHVRPAASRERSTRRSLHGPHMPHNC